MKGADMKFKNILGFCSCKGCKNRYSFDMEATKSNGKKIKHRLCSKHAMELMKYSKLRSVTLEQKIDFQEENI